MTREPTERHIPFERLVNCRDLGGYRTGDGRTLRWGRLFRSASLQHMSEKDLRRARELGIRTVIDLRRPDEVADTGSGPFVEPPVNRHWLPLVPEGGSAVLDERYGRGISGERYVGYLTFDPGLFVQALELLADESTYPALFHCTAGKDRTGVIAALTLDILGVDGETIAEDYALSNLAAGPLLEHLQRSYDLQKRNGALPEGAPPPAFPAAEDYRPVPPDAIMIFLEGVRRDFGSARGFFEAQGVPGATFEALAAALLE